MIYVTDNSINYVVLTLQENSQLWSVSGISPYYLFEFVSPATNVGMFFVGTNLSTTSQKLRFDSFNITLTGSTYINLSASTIYMRPGVFWTYNVWEQNNQYNFNPALAVGLVETGKLMFSATTISQAQIFTSYTGNTTTRTIYTNY